MSAGATIRSVEIAESSVAALQSLPPWIGVAGVGVLLLLFGRKLYWLLLGAVGFVFGFGLLSQFVATSTSWAPWVAGLAGGIVGILAAFFVQGALLAVVGALLGAMGALVAVSMWGTVSPIAAIVVAVVGAILGAVVLRKVFFGALIVATSLAGAGLLMETLTQMMARWAKADSAGDLPGWLWNLALPGPEHTVLFVVLVAIGIVYQASGKNRSREEQKLRTKKRRLEKDVERLSRAKRAAAD